MFVELVLDLYKWCTCEIMYRRESLFHNCDPWALWTWYNVLFKYHFRSYSFHSKNIFRYVIYEFNTISNCDNVYNCEPKHFNRYMDFVPFRSSHILSHLVFVNGECRHKSWDKEIKQNPNTLFKLRLTCLDHVEVFTSSLKSMLFKHWRVLACPSKTFPYEI